MPPRTIRRSLSAPLSPIATGATADGPEPPFYASAQDQQHPLLGHIDPSLPPLGPLYSAPLVAPGHTHFWPIQEPYGYRPRDEKMPSSWTRTQANRLSLEARPDGANHT